MGKQQWDALIIGSGAGAAAAAYSLVHAGKSVLMLEKGEYLPTDGSTLDVGKVFAGGQFKNKQAWLDGQGRQFVPEEYYNVGGKTKWYGAALLRISPHEFEEDHDFACLPWPVAYSMMEPWYQQAEKILQVTHFDFEPDLIKLISRAFSAGSGWRYEHLPLGLNKTILEHPNEARHFDGFASATGQKSEAETSLLTSIKDAPNFTLLRGKTVASLVSTDDDPTEITGVVCADNSCYAAQWIILAAGAMASPRLLQHHLTHTGLDKILPSASLVGRNFKMHLNSALMAFSVTKKRDLLRKTAIFFNDAFPHSTVQCLGWLDGEILASQLPSFVPRFASNALGSRAMGFFITTEDGSSPKNRVVAATAPDEPAILDYRQDRLPASVKEHRNIIRSFSSRLRTAGMLPTHRAMGLSGTAHALGSMVTGCDPRTSVVDVHGQVHGLTGLYVADGSVLPRSSRVNPALSIYAWGLRLGDWLARDHASKAMLS